MALKYLENLEINRLISLSHLSPTCPDVHAQHHNYLSTCKLAIRSISISKMMSVPLFPNKAVLALFAAAECRENAAGGEYLGTRPSAVRGKEWISALLLSGSKPPSFLGDNVHA